MRDAEREAETAETQTRRRISAHLRLARQPSLLPDTAFQLLDPEETQACELDANLHGKRFGKLVAKQKLEPGPVRRVHSEMTAISLTEGIAKSPPACRSSFARSCAHAMSPPACRASICKNCAHATSPPACRAAASGAGKIFRPDREAKVAACSNRASPSSLPMPAFASGELNGVPLRWASAN